MHCGRCSVFPPQHPCLFLFLLTEFTSHTRRWKCQIPSFHASLAAQGTSRTSSDRWDMRRKCAWNLKDRWFSNRDVGKALLMSISFISVLDIVSQEMILKASCCSHLPTVKERPRLLQRLSQFSDEPKQA